MNTKKLPNNKEFFYKRSATSKKVSKTDCIYSVSNNFYHVKYRIKNGIRLAFDNDVRHNQRFKINFKTTLASRKVKLTLKHKRAD